MKNEYLFYTQELAQTNIIFAPANFLCASIEQLQFVCNGCGAADSHFRPPSTIYGTSIIEACIIHDWMYQHGRSIEDKHEADRVFLNNMIRLIMRDANDWYRPTFLQKKRAMVYYRSVSYFGGDAFWKGKNGIV